MRALLKALVLSAGSLAWALPVRADFSRPVELAPADRVTPGIELLGVLELAPKAPDGTPVTGLSGLAWDADEQILYALSDRGRLFHLRPRFREGRLESVDVVGSYRLRDAEGRKLRGTWRDSEDLALANAANGKKGDTALWISFEHHPRVILYSPKGRIKNEVALPEPLRDIDNYASPNQALEALALHPDLGLVMAPEAGLKDDAAGTLSFFAQDGRRWTYRPASAPGSSVVALDTLPDGRFLVLERAFVSIFWPLVISFRTVGLAENRQAVQTTLALLDTSRGWRLDNFEGLAHHEADRFFMVSDDNGNARQKTYLVYLRLPGLAEASG